jgi:hypothetical protein
MKQTLVRLFLILFFVVNVFPVTAQATCNLAPRLAVGEQGIVLVTDGQPLNIRDAASINGQLVAQLPEGNAFTVIEGPVCADGLHWWRIQSGEINGWSAEGMDGAYFVAPFTAPVSGGATFTGEVNPFATWDWLAAAGIATTLPDPMTMTLPPVYAGDLPALPVNLDDVLFVDDAGLNAQQLALLAQNGFVVVPAQRERFYSVYVGDADWNPYSGQSSGGDELTPESLGQPYFITTDVMLHNLHLVFGQLLIELEKNSFYPHLIKSLVPMLEAANGQYQQAIGTTLEKPARNVVVYLAVTLSLLQEPPLSRNGLADFGHGQDLLAALPTDIMQEAQSVVNLIVAAEGVEEISFLTDYTESFGIYRVRGHYEGDAMLESYFRAMAWLGRMTFRAKEAEETLSALLLMRVLRDAPGAYESWQAIHDTITFIIGPVDDLGPPDYLPLVDAVYGGELSLENLGNPELLTAFRQQIATLPGPRINGLTLPADTAIEDIDQLTRGFRLMGQRFTFDGYVLGQLFTPFVEYRVLPSGLDVPAAMGSDLALSLANEAGAADLEAYASQMAAMRSEIGQLEQANWLENSYSSWLWMLDPLWTRDNPESYPPLMLTDAWLRHDLQTGLASYTELKHDTVLYAKQPEGLGGGGPPLLAYGYVEPNPLVFARIAVVAGTMYQGLVERGQNATDRYMEMSDTTYIIGYELRRQAGKSARFADMAWRELAGEPLTDDDYYTIQIFSNYLETLDINLFTEKHYNHDLDPVALVTDIATETTTQTVLQQAVGAVDFIYVVIPGPVGPQVARGGVFSYYEFIGSADARMTDSEWRDIVTSGNLPRRPDWVGAFFSE